VDSLQAQFILLPILLPLVGAGVAILVRKNYRFQQIWSLGILTASLVVSLWLLISVQNRGAPIVYQLGNWSASIGIVLVADLLAAFFVLMVQLVMVAGLVYALGSKDDVTCYPMFYPLFLTMATSLSGAFLTGDLFNLYVFAELLVISGAVLTALSDDRYGVEAAYKYFYISLLASVFLLLGIGSLYISYGTLNMAILAQRVAQEGEKMLLLPAIGLLLASFMIKSAVFPFHFWQPDFHTASPTPVSAMLSSIVVKLGVYGFLRMTTLLFSEQAVIIRAILLIAGVVGILFGGFSAIGTHNVKRMLAYSTLAQIGFILVGIGWGTTLSIAAAIVFSFNHSLIKAAMLMLAGYVASHASVKSAGFEVVTGVGRKLPGAGIFFFLGAMALSGMPPMNGFLGKLMLFQGGFSAERYWSLAVIGLASILTLIYTFRAFQRIWWQAPAEGIYTKPGGDQLFAPAFLISMALLLGIWAEPLVSLTIETSVWLANPSNYLAVVLGG
jgi:multicomponent Na+:H+ antiporter subunit D